MNRAEKATLQLQAVRILVSPVVFLISMIIAYFDPTVAILSWLLLIPINGVVQSRLLESVQESTLETEIGT